MLWLAIIKTIQVLIRLEKNPLIPRNIVFLKQKKKQINILTKHLNPKKTTGADGKPLKIIKLPANVID